MNFSTPTLLFGLPLYIRKEDAKILHRFLDSIWKSNYLTPTKDIEDDLTLMSLYFNPISTGAKLRSALEKMPNSIEIPSLPFSLDGLIINLSSRKHLLRPEGRIALSILESTGNRNSENVILDSITLLWAYSILHSRYEQWNSQRLVSVIDNLSGSKTLQIQSLGLLIWLLINRNNSIVRALPKNIENSQFRRKMDKLVDVPVTAFASALSKNFEKKDRQELSIYSGWQLSEAKRRLGGRLVIEPSVYIAESADEEVLDIIIHDLSKRKNTHQEISDGLDSFMKNFQDVSSSLAALGFFFEDTRNTRKVINKIKSAVSNTVKNED
ncbi:hypothetical protein ACFP9V_11580 [Deinococcus radiopugnans]|uniref:Uncharacterized protein n=1 Tax=Deinococcus radiopugnans ATCC 19172 TaxID=585398 RepID=A0A5C4Y9V9_9DEIO|nr:hypothetical protein [Deinococcus radiopugnans]MBB6015961.1 hypothetical protein [Deinococcus radiopugnans ATCC 19172]TNM72349.1 hypothetical protein FHR04_03365 [Deinococcus radiopugnans ATCC 19172]